MARARPVRTATAGQLTLDDWSELLSASQEAPETPAGEAPNVEPLPRTRATSAKAAEQANHHHPAAKELLETPGALLTRTHLRELGLERRAIDAVFRKLPVIALPGYSRPLVRAEEYLDLIAEHTYRDDRVRPSHA